LEIEIVLGLSSIEKSISLFGGSIDNSFGKTSRKFERNGYVSKDN
jgi:hypothetical protein